MLSHMLAPTAHQGLQGLAHLSPTVPITLFAPHGIMKGGSFALVLLAKNQRPADTCMCQASLLQPWMGVACPPVPHSSCGRGQASVWQLAATGDRQLSERW